MSGLDQEISDYATGILLRYYRTGSHVDPGSPHIEIERDREILRSHWALSAPVRNLVHHLLTHRHETQALLTTKRRIEDAVARGRLDVRATILHRMQSGMRSAMVVEEPIRTFETGPNQVLAWVVHHARTWASRFQGTGGSGLNYAALADAVLLDIDGVRRLEALRDALRSPTVTRRPSPGALRDAARSRRLVYRLAVEAYGVLKDLEAGQDEAIRLVIGSTLVGPLEIWRRLELAVAVAIGQALETETGIPLHLNPVAGDGGPIATCGRFAVFWQQLVTKLHKPPALEESEARSRAILGAFGIAAGSDRPDLVLVDVQADIVLAVIEVKYLAADTATARFREAVDQIVRYSRGYAWNQPLDGLIGRSLVVMSVKAPDLKNPAPGVPTALDFDDVTHGLLGPWTRALLLQRDGAQAAGFGSPVLG